MKKLLVIDGNSILNRAFYGIRLLSASNGKYTNAIYGAINMITKQLEALEPEYAAVAFDLKHPTFRKEIFDGYKATRHQTPPELLSQFDDAKACLRGLGLNIMELPGYEADDLLGTASSFVKDAPDTEAYIFSGDRDLLQLIDSRTFVLLAGNTDTTKYDEARFFEKYSTTPPRLVDIKSLMGDSSDNIPGVPGIGEKTAIKLISTFGTLEGVYENINDPSITNSVRAKLESGRESAEMSYKLAKICRTAPVKFTLEDLRRREIDSTGLYRKFTELEFYGFIKKFGLSESASRPMADTCEVQDIGILTSDEFIEEMGQRFAIICDSNGVFTGSGKSGVCCSYMGDAEDLSPLFDGSCEVVCYDVKSLIHTLDRAGVEMKCMPRDLMLASYVINSSDGTSDIRHLAMTYLSYLPPDGAEAGVMLELDDVLKRKLEEYGCTELYEKIELPCAMTLARMEDAGFRIDRVGLEDFGKELDAAAEASKAAIYELAGHEFNINSPKQLGEVLFDELGLPYGKKTKKGYSTSAEILEKLRPYNPIIDEILNYRQVTKLYSTYVLGLLKAADGAGRVHTDFKQAFTATGRLSSSEPNLQNIPIRTPLGRRMRKYFIPDDGYMLVDADYSQIELRLLAHISGDEVMQNAFLSGEDIHTKTAAAVFHVAEADVTPDMRKKAKAVNFGIVYGIGEYSLSQDLKISRAAAGEYIHSYIAKYPKVEAYLKGVVEDAYRDGYVSTIFGRRRYIPELKNSNKNLRSFGERVAMNSPLQGSAADIMKLAMINVDSALRRAGIDARIVMQVHDELVLEARADCAAQAAEILKREMEGAVKLSVPLTCDVNIAENWFE